MYIITLIQSIIFVLQIYETYYIDKICCEEVRYWTNHKITYVTFFKWKESDLYGNWNTLFFFYKKPRVRGSGSAFLRIPEFESQKFLRSIKIPVFSFLTFSYFEPLIFLKFYTKNTSRTIILDFWSKELSFCIKCWWNWYPTE